MTALFMTKDAVKLCIAVMLVSGICMGNSLIDNLGVMRRDHCVSKGARSLKKPSLAY